MRNETKFKKGFALIVGDLIYKPNFVNVLIFT